MGTKELQTKNQVELDSIKRRNDLEYVQEKFDVGSSVELLHKMMKEVTQKEFSSRNVNAACNCIHELNNTINTTIRAAKFLRDGSF